MGVCRIFVIDNYYGMELPEHIDMKQAHLQVLIESVDDKEIVKETYDENGLRLSRIETDYTASGLVSEIREFSDDFEHPFQVARYHYNESGKLVMEQTFHDEEQSFGTQYVYDALGRLMQSRATDEEGVHHDVLYSYDIGMMEPKAAMYLNGSKCWQEIQFKYEDAGNKHLVTEEIIDHKEDRFQSRIIRHYVYGTKPNGVVTEFYNSDGRFIEEIREIRDEKGNILHEGLYADEADDAVPYKVEVSEYDAAGNLTFYESSYHRQVTARQISAYDSRKRKTTEIVSGQGSALYIYKYED